MIVFGASFWFAMFSCSITSQFGAVALKGQPIFCYLPNYNTCERTSYPFGFTCFLSLESCQKIFDHTKGMFYYDPGASKCVESDRRILQGKVTLFESHRRCTRITKKFEKLKETCSNGQNGICKRTASRVAFRFNSRMKKCVTTFLKPNTRTTFYVTKALCVIDRRNRFCFNRKTESCLKTTVKEVKHSVCFAYENDCTRYGGKDEKKIVAKVEKLPEPVRFCFNRKTESCQKVALNEVKNSNCFSNEDDCARYRVKEEKNIATKVKKLPELGTPNSGCFSLMEKDSTCTFVEQKRYYCDPLLKLYTTKDECEECKNTAPKYALFVTARQCNKTDLHHKRVPMFCSMNQCLRRLRVHKQYADPKDVGRHQFLKGRCVSWDLDSDDAMVGDPAAYFQTFDECQQYAWLFERTYPIKYYRKYGYCLETMNSEKGLFTNQAKCEEENVVKNRYVYVLQHDGTACEQWWISWYYLLGKKIDPPWFDSYDECWDYVMEISRTKTLWHAPS